MESRDTPEQAALRAAVASFVSSYGTPDRVRAAMGSAVGYDRATWTRLSAELGLPGLAGPDRFGGSGAGLAEVAVAVAEFGRALLPSPYLSTALVAALLTEGLERPGPGADFAAAHLPGLVDGTLIGSIALRSELSAAELGTLTGVAEHVVDGGAADVFLVADGPTLVAVRRDDVRVEASETLDQTRRQAVLRLNATPAVPVGRTDRARGLYQVLTAVECVAGAEHCLDVTVAYLKTRRQFGRPIGSFQALKHRCADLAVELAASRAIVAAAVSVAASLPSSDDAPVGLDALAPLAALHAVRTYVHVTAEMIQLHGGMGFTWEHEAHLYYKRAKSTQLLLGRPTELRTEIGRAAGRLPALG